MLPGIVMNVVVGLLDGGAKVLREAFRGGLGFGGPRLHQVAEDVVHRHGTGDLSRRGSPHAVGHHEQDAPRTDSMRSAVRQVHGPVGQVRHQERILIVITGPAEIGTGAGGDRDRAFGGGHVT